MTFDKIFVLEKTEFEVMGDGVLEREVEVEWGFGKFPRDFWDITGKILRNIRELS